MSNFRFEMRDGAVSKIDASSGLVVSRHNPIGTKVVQVLRKGEHLVVREDYYLFPSQCSNVYCLDRDFKTIWTAELPSTTDIYANEVIDMGDTLVCNTWDCYRCQLDPSSGRIVGKVFTK